MSSLDIGTFPTRTGKPRRGARPAKLSEAEITKQCCDVARFAGFRPLRLQSGLFKRVGGAPGRIRIGEPGLQDWLFLRPVESGVLQGFFCEFKGEGKLRTLEQIRETLRNTKVPNQKDIRTMGAQLAKREELTMGGFLVLSTDSVEQFKDWLGSNFT